jgi:MFS family permease
MSRRAFLFALLFANFLFTLQFTLVIYQNSSVLGYFVPGEAINSLYTGYAIASMFVLAGMGALLSRFGNRRIILSLLFANTLALFVLGLSEWQGLWALPYLVAISFALHSAVAFIVKTNLDFYAEDITSFDSAGKIRGQILTVNNVAWLLGPALAGLLISAPEFYGRAYFASAVVSFLLLFLIARVFRDVPDRPYRGESFLETLREVRSRPNVRHIFMANFLMHFFFAWMVIYLSPLLKDVVGFSPREISLVIVVMLIPYLIVDFPLGRIADEYLGEKELLVVGFVVTAFFTFFIPFLESRELFVWAAVLFGTRVGAATIEIMSETYFFKKIHPGDEHLISFFRNGQPLAYVVGPLAAMALVFSYNRYFNVTGVPYSFLFLCLSFIILYGVRYALSIRDTR